MVRKIPPDVEEAIIRYWLEGYNYRQIGNKTMVSIGKISGIINKKRVTTPDIGELREFYLSIRAQKSSYIDTLRGAKFLERLDKLDVSLGQVDSCIRLLNQYGKEAGHILALTDRLKKLEASSGRTYGQIVDDFLDKSKQLEEIERRIGELKAKEEGIRSSLYELDRLRELSLKMENNKITISDLDKFIEHSRKLSQLQFTPYTAELFAIELSRIGLQPSKAATLLTNSIQEYQGLEDALRSLRSEKQDVEQEIKDKQLELNSLNRQITNAAEQHKTYMDLIEEKKSIIRVLDLTYVNKNKQLESNYAEKKIVLEFEVMSLDNKKTMLAKEIEGLKKNKAEAEATTKEVMDKIEHIKKLYMLSSLLREPMGEYDLREVLEVANAIVHSINVHLEKYRAYPAYKATIGHIRGLNFSLVVWLKIAS